MIGQYAHGNEPSHHVVYLYRFSNQPQKTETLVKKICNDFYKNQPDGLIGNDDCGQMSAWYIFSTLGFYPVNPAGGNYILGRSQAKRLKICRPGERSLIIHNHNRTTIQWNGREIRKFEISHRELIKGGHLEF